MVLEIDAYFSGHARRLYDDDYDDDGDDDDLHDKLNQNQVEICLLQTTR